MFSEVVNMEFSTSPKRKNRRAVPHLVSVCFASVASEIKFSIDRRCICVRSFLRFSSFNISLRFLLDVPACVHFLGELSSVSLMNLFGFQVCLTVVHVVWGRTFADGLLVVSSILFYIEVNLGDPVNF